MSEWMKQDVVALDGTKVSLEKYAGRVLLVVNTASECGFTKQYAGLETLYQSYKDRGFDVLGFPSNDFGNQEPGTSAEIGAFCTSRFAVTFPMFEKISVKGANQHPLYRDLVAAAPHTTDDGNGLRDQLTEFAKSKGLPAPIAGPDVLWNFEKFLIGRDGAVIERFASTVAPDDERLRLAVEKALAA